MLYIFDKDGTLISGLGTRPANTPEEQVVLPGVVEKLTELRMQRNLLAIASNQGGVELGYINHDQATRLLMDCAEKCGGGFSDLQFCPHFKGTCTCRKPEPGMILDIARGLGVSLNDVVYVGDRDTDQEAARRANVRFVWAKDFFGWRS